MNILNKIKEKGLVRNFSVLVVCNFGVHLANLLINMLLARMLGPNDFGIYGIIITWATIIQTIASLGIQQVTIRHIAKERQKSYHYFKISLISRIIGYLCTISCFCIYSYICTEYSILFILFAILYSISLFMWDSIQNVAFGLQRMESTGYINLAGSFLLLLIYVCIPTQFFNIGLIICTLITVQIVKDIIYYYSCAKEGFFIKDNNKDEPHDCYILIKESFPFYIISLFSLFTTQFPVLFLSRHTNNIEVAYFNTANKLMVPLTMILQTLMTAIYPKFVNDFSTDLKKFHIGANKLLRLMITLSIIFCLIISCFRNEIVLTIYGMEYKNTGDIMLTQSWYVVYFSILSYYGTLLASIGKDKSLASLSIINSLFSGIILWFTSYYGSATMSLGFVFCGAINLASNSAYLYYSRCQIFTNKTLLCANGVLLLSTLLSILL